VQIHLPKASNLRSHFYAGGSLFQAPKMRNNLIKQWVGGANSVWGKQSPATLCLNLSDPPDLILTMEKYVVFSVTCLKPLILAYFRDLL